MNKGKKYPRGMCWWLNKCDWWNPPKKMRIENKGADYCIRCWRFKK